MTETKIELSGSCRFTLTTYENIGHKDVCLDYTEHSSDAYYSDTETSIDIDANKAREIVAFMHKAFPEIEQPAQPLRGEQFVQIARAIAPRTVMGLKETIPNWVVEYGRAIEAAHGIKENT